MGRNIVSRIAKDDRVETWRRKYRYVNLAAGVAGLGSFLMYHGGVLTASSSMAIIAITTICLLMLIGETVGVYFASGGFKEGWKRAAPDSLAIIGGILTALALLLFSPLVLDLLDAAQIEVAVFALGQVGMMLFTGMRFLRFVSFMARFVASPLIIFAGSFIAIILTGAGLLLLPGARTIDLSFVDAIFMATSATCVTGLSTMNIATDLTPFGQGVILILIQIGGLGIMSFAAFFSLFFGRGMGVRDQAAMGEVLNVDLVGTVGKTVGWIFGITICVEALGAFALYGHWVDAAGAALPVGLQLYYSVFHSISAFCNAGFSMYSDSMVQYAGEWPVVLSISSLVIVGGLGFTVILDVLTYRPWAHRSLRRVKPIRRRLKDLSLPRISLQSKFVLSATAVLLLVGTFGFWALEADNTLAGMSVGDQFAASIFQGMTPRTAGFNSVDIGELKPATTFFLILQMVIGASPGSTGGGLKTTTFIVMGLAVLATLRGRNAEAFGRQLPDQLIRKALVMLVLALVFMNFATLGLMLTERTGAAGGQYGFEQITFEVVSAFCTVGLTTGITNELTGAGKFIIIACMFVGRVGPLTLVLAIGSRRAKPFEYPSERVMIG
ncbi:potassium transporter TrkG [Planctomycetota bacterium]|nr:potassium transporter TrkG [Planctomycetota bacterium]